MNIPGFEYFEKEDNKPSLNDLLKIDDLSFNAEKICKDEDFVSSFSLAVPDIEEQKKYLINTSRYDSGQECDPNYVLFFRRTLPSNTPKHEERWTNQIFTVLNGLRREIPFGPHRYHSIILCDSLAHLISNGEKNGETNAFTDGEIVVNFPNYDQNTCICKFKPDYEKKLLEEYLKTENALTQEEILSRVQEEILQRINYMMWE
ncbi:hypothetical protein CVV38_02425 [Candidatus Peregrinibacteria bacterium HGW-Peregrinibacteria-1]|jgi:hypothetical protein|nr:MAG: hypothetical protein CVV38_02425 [Candidatus Peregrinibacteria bacterium HGW-Peregrinibacteria-1]